MKFCLVLLLIVLDTSKFFWTGPKCFGPGQKQLFTIDFCVFEPYPKHLEKNFGPVQTSFGPLEGQGIHLSNTKYRSINVENR